MKTMKRKTLLVRAMALLLLPGLTACENAGSKTADVSAKPKEAHEPITIMSGGRAYSGFIEHMDALTPSSIRWEP